MAQSNFRIVVDLKGIHLSFSSLVSDTFFFSPFSREIRKKLHGPPPPPGVLSPRFLAHFRRKLDFKLVRRVPSSFIALYCSFCNIRYALFLSARSPLYVARQRFIIFIEGTCTTCMDWIPRGHDNRTIREQIINWESNDFFPSFEIFRSEKFPQSSNFT